MGVRSYLRVVRHYWALIVVGFTVGLAVAGAVTLAQTPRYASEITMVLSPPASAEAGGVYDGSVLATQKATSYSQLLSDETLAGDVIDQLRLDMTPAELAGNITASARPDTSLITARVTADSPAIAQQIAQVLGERYAVLIADLERPANPTGTPALTLRIAQPATFGDKAISPQPMLALGLGAILGLLAGLAVAVALERTRRPVRSTEDVSDLAPLLGTVPAAPKGNALTCVEEAPASMAEPFRRIRARLALGPARRPGWVIGVVSPCPGDGRTVVASNLALAISRTGRRVALVDADLRVARLSAAMTPDDVTWPGLADVLSGSVALGQALHRRSSHPLHLLPAGAAPARPGDPLGSRAFNVAIAELAARHDVVVIDTPALGQVADALDVAPLCHGVVLVARDGRTGRDDLRAAADSVRAVNGFLLGVVVNAAPAGRAGASPRYSASTEGLPTTAFPLLRTSFADEVRFTGTPASNGLPGANGTPASYRTPAANGATAGEGVPVGNRAAARNRARPSAEPAGNSEAHVDADVIGRLPASPPGAPRPQPHPR